MPQRAGFLRQILLEKSSKTNASSLSNTLTNTNTNTNTVWENMNKNHIFDTSALERGISERVISDSVNGFLTNGSNIYHS